ncbi:MAG: hypothetical protein HQ582_00590 [Planctomycetes bacterium]|nr:hypothetical protein [Planctomycetota bacterium]
MLKLAGRAMIVVNRAIDFTDRDVGSSGRQGQQKGHQVLYLVFTQVACHTMAIRRVMRGENLGQASCAAVMQVGVGGVEAEQRGSVKGRALAFSRSVARADGEPHAYVCLKPR